MIETFFCKKVAEYIEKRIKVVYNINIIFIIMEVIL